MKADNFRIARINPNVLSSIFYAFKFLPERTLNDVAENVEKGARLQQAVADGTSQLPITVQGESSVSTAVQNQEKENRSHPRRESERNGGLV